MDRQKCKEQYLTMTAINNILLEGVDCVGKSTIARKFVDLGYTLKKFGAVNTFEEGIEQNIEIINFVNKNKGYVLDRSILGEAVYGPIIRNYEVNYMRDFEKKINPHNYLFLLNAFPETIYKRFDGEYISKDDIKNIIYLYFEEFSKSLYKNKACVFVSRDKTPQIVFEEIQEYINFFNDKLEIYYKCKRGVF